MLGERGVIWNTANECPKLAQHEQKRCHYNVARMIQWELCGNYDVQRAKTLYDQAPEGVAENENYKILWDVMIQCDHPTRIGNWTTF